MTETTTPPTGEIGLKVLEEQISKLRDKIKKITNVKLKEVKKKQLQKKESELNALMAEILNSKSTKNTEEKADEEQESESDNNTEEENITPELDVSQLHIKKELEKFKEEVRKEARKELERFKEEARKELERFKEGLKGEIIELSKTNNSSNDTLEGKNKNTSSDLTSNTSQGEDNTKDTIKTGAFKTGTDMDTPNNEQLMPPPKGITLPEVNTDAHVNKTHSSTKNTSSETSLSKEAEDDSHQNNKQSNLSVSRLFESKITNTLIEDVEQDGKTPISIDDKTKLDTTKKPNFIHEEFKNDIVNEIKYNTNYNLLLKIIFYSKNDTNKLKDLVNHTDLITTNTLLSLAVENYNLPAFKILISTGLVEEASIEEARKEILENMKDADDVHKIILNEMINVLDNPDLAIVFYEAEIKNNNFNSKDTLIEVSNDDIGPI